MQARFIYPGTFSPPTYGHLRIVKEAAELFPEVTVVCSVNDDKNPLFTPEETKELWRTYELPPNVVFMTLDEFIQSLTSDSQIIMIRGIRGEEDLDQERATLLYNLKEFGIRRFMYVVSDKEHKDISSTKAREAAGRMDLKSLSRYVSPLIVTALLQKAHDIDKLFLVVGRPGSGKSTFLEKVCAEVSGSVHVNTDDYNHRLRPWLETQFPDEDIREVAKTRLQEITDLMAPAWIELLENALLAHEGATNVFVEIPYALRDTMNLFQLVGGNVIYVGCEDAEENARRIAGRGKGDQTHMIELIPDLAGSTAIAKANNLQLVSVDTSGTLDDLDVAVQKFIEDVELGK